MHVCENGFSNAELCACGHCEPRRLYCGKPQAYLDIDVCNMSGFWLRMPFVAFLSFRSASHCVMGESGTERALNRVNLPDLVRGWPVSKSAKKCRKFGRMRHPTDCVVICSRPDRRTRYGSGRARSMNPYTGEVFVAKGFEINRQVVHNTLGTMTCVHMDSNCQPLISGAEMMLDSEGCLVYV